MKKAVKSHKLPVFGARSSVEEETDGDDVIFINHQKFVKRTVDDVTAYFADGTTAGVARQYLAAMKPKKHAPVKHEHVDPEALSKEERERHRDYHAKAEPKPTKRAIGPLADRGVGRIEGVRYIETKSKSIKK